MPKKIANFFKKPSNLLAVMVSFAVLGIGSMFAMQAFADGDVPVATDAVLANYSTAVINYLYAETYDDYFVQVYCSEAGTETASLTYTGSNGYLDSDQFKKNGEAFNLYKYDSDGDHTPDQYYSSSTLTASGEIPSKKYYVFQYLYNSQTDSDEETYVGSFDLKDFSDLKKVLVNGSSPYYSASDLIKKIGLDSSDAQGTYSPSKECFAYDDKGSYVEHQEEIWEDVEVPDDPENPDGPKHWEYQFTGDYYTYYAWENHGDSLYGASASSLLSNAGFDFTSATYSFLGIKERTFYKYGDRVPLENNYHSATGVQVILPNGNNLGSQSYIGLVGEYDTDSYAINNSSALKSISMQSLAGVLGIPGDAGTVMTYADSSGNIYLPVSVDVNYSVVSPNEEKVLVRHTDLDEVTQNVYDNTWNNCMLDSGLSGGMDFRPDIGEDKPQYYNGTEYTNAADVPEAEWQDAICWESVNDSEKTFPLSSYSTIKGLFSATNYICASSGGAIHLSVPVMAQFPIPQTYTLQYNLNKPDGTTVNNPSHFVEVGNIDKSAVENGNYHLASAEPQITGYSFKGWTLNNGEDYDSETGVPFSCFDNEECTAIATANWEINKHKVKYYVYGSKPAGYNKPADMNEVLFNTEVTVAELPPTYKGYSFEGWTVSGATPESGKFKMPDKDVSIYGTFTEWIYSIEYVDNAPAGKTVTDMPNNTATQYSYVKDGSYKLATQVPACEGYTFDGWKLNNGEDYDSEAGVPFDCFDNDGRKAVATAQWKAIPTHQVSYTVNKPANSSDISYTAPASATYYEGQTGIAVADVPEAGTDYDSARYSFVGWNTEDVSVISNKFTMPTKDVNFTGTFIKRKYTLSYSVTGAPQGYSVPPSAEHEVDSTVDVANVPSIPGYTFEGWKQGDEVVTSITMPAADVTLTGVFSKIPYHVTYSVTGAPDGYSAPTDTDDHFVGDTFDVKAKPDMSLYAGYTFEGWKQGDEAVTSITMPAADVTLTGVFSKIPYHVTYSVTGAPDGYSAPTDTDDHFAGDTFDVKAKPDMSLYAGYTFEGWKQGDEAVTSITMPAADVTLTGVFSKIPYHVTYTVTGAPDGYSAPTDTDDHFVGDTFDVKAKPDMSLYAGYTFEGWKQGDEAVTSITMPAADVTLTGVFSKLDQVTLKYSANRGNGEEIIDTLTRNGYTQVSETIADLPASYTREGYTFAGVWNTKPDGSGADNYLVGTAQTFTANTTLYAVWNENQYDLDYQDGGKTGATIPEDKSGLGYTLVKDGYQLSDLEPTVTGFSFRSWLVNGIEYATGATIPFSAFSNSSKTAVAVAQWNDWTYKVIYQKGTGHDSAANMPKGRNIDGSVDNSSSVQQFILGNFRTEPYAMIDRTVPTDSGFTFAGWSVQKATGDVTITAGELATAADSDLRIFEDWFDSDTLTLTVTAKWEADYQLLYYDGDTLLSGTQTVPYSEGFAGISIERENLADIENTHFIGWFDDDSTYVKGNTVPASRFDDNHIAKVYARWRAVAPVQPTYLLHFADNRESYNVVINDFYNEMKDITGMPETVTLTEDQLKAGHTLPKTGPDSYNYEFIGWSNAANKAYTSDEKIGKVTLLDFNGESELTVYAKWKAKMLVTYSSGLIDEATQATEFVVDVYNVNGYIVKANNQLNPPFKREGFEIKTWQVTEGNDLIEVIEQPSSGDGTGSGEPAAKTAHANVDWLEPGTKVSFHGNIMLKAEWTPASPVTLTYYANGGSPQTAVPNGGESINHFTGDLVTVQSGDSLKKGDQVFNYWSTSSNDENGNKHYKTGDKFTINANTKLYAIYKDAPDSGSNEFTVTYSANGAKGTPPVDKNKYTGGDTVYVLKMEDLTKEGCTFKEWNTKPDGSGTGYNGDGTDSFIMPSSNVTLYAIWVDSSGKIVSPGTGESDMPLVLALNVLVLSLLAGSYVLLRQRRARSEEA